MLFVTRAHLIKQLHFLLLEYIHSTHWRRSQLLFSVLSVHAKKKKKTVSGVIKVSIVLTVPFVPCAGGDSRCSKTHLNSLQTAVRQLREALKYFSFVFGGIVTDIPKSQSVAVQQISC